MKIKHLMRYALLAVLGSGLCLPGHAQSTTQGAISGTLTDNSDAAIPGAQVVIHNDATNADIVLTTDASGLFRAPQLAPGTYTVTFRMQGFQERRETGVIVQVNTVTALNSQLRAGDVATTVEVTADVPVLNFDSPQFGGHLSNTEIENIPINNRRWSALALTTPAVTNDANGFGLLSFRAISAVLNNVQIDGADDNQAFFSEERGRTRAGYSTSQAAVREFQVNTGVYSAEFGRAVGGVVNSVTKSGGNQLHGELYFYNRNSSRSAFVPGATNTTFVPSNPPGSQYVTAPYRPKDNRNQYGFGVGGPLIKDKLFWFYAFDAFRRNFPGTAKANDPKTFFVNADAALPTGQTCSLATGTISGGTASTANSGACLLAARLKYATYGGGASAYNTQLQNLLTNLGSVPRFGNQLINTPKLDWQVTPKHHVSALYHRMRWDSPGGVQTQGTNNYAIDTFGTDFVKLDYGVAKLDSLFTSRITNEVRYQYGRELNNQGLQPSSQYTLNNLINNTGLAPEVALNTNVGFYMGMPYYSFRVAYPDERKWQIGDTASFLIGRHNLRVGADIVHNYDLQNNVYEGNGYINYTSTVNYFSDLLSKGKTCNASGSGVGGGTAASNYPCYSFYAAGFGPAVFQLSTVDYAFFAQDDWKATPRLTLNLGVRYDYESIPAPFAGLNGTAAGTLAITSSHPSDKNNISPRVGFSYDPFGLGKTVVRGGFGMYFGRIPNSVILNAYQNTGSPSSQSTPSFTTSNTGATALPSLQVAPTGPAPGTRTAYYLDNHLQNPYTLQFDLAVQQDLGHSSVLSLSYLGALGRELPNFTNYNLDPTKTYQIPYTVKPAANGSCGPLQCGQTYYVTGYAGRAITTNTSTNLGAIDPTFGSVTGVVSNINSNFNAMNVDVTNRSYKLIQFDANYTWAHALDYSQNQFTAASVNNFIDPFANPRNNYGNSSLNVRHRLVGWASFNAPNAVHSDSAWKYLANGWSLKPLVQMQTGLPYSAVTTGTTPQSCYSSTINPIPTGVTCYAAAGTGIAGTSSSSSYMPFFGRNTFTMPRTILVDLRAQKDFLFMEKYNLQLIGEAFNLANHQNVTGINGTGYAISTSQGNTPATTSNSLTYQPSFGTVTSANSNYAYGPRVIQLALRFMF
jgi:outer membrane receptor protein involved in Fe transport